MDNEITAYPSPALLTSLKEVAIQTNKKWSLKLGIPSSSAITCIKPSGTVSQLVDSSSGIHARHAPYYIRRVRMDIKDPLCTFMIEKNFTSEPDVLNPSNIVFSFPQKSPEEATHRGELSALEQLDLWSQYSRHFCEHKPSCTISVKEEEWVDVGAWVYENFDSISGISFLPYTDHVYAQAPYEECTIQQYLDLESRIPEIDWKELTLFEKEDYTIASQELACTGNSCEII